jgi:uncharacterized surface protein with fasciclin (FAS1) repeats
MRGFRTAHASICDRLFGRYECDRSSSTLSEERASHHNALTYHVALGIVTNERWLEQMDYERELTNSKKRVTKLETKANDSKVEFKSLLYQND